MEGVLYLTDVEQFKRVCPNCSRHDEDYVECVDRYGSDLIRDGEGEYCSRCGFCFEVD